MSWKEILVWHVIGLIDLVILHSWADALFRSYFRNQWLFIQMLGPPEKEKEETFHEPQDEKTKFRNKSLN